LYATPDVVLEVREQSPAARPVVVVHDQALIEISPELGPVAVVPTAPLDVAATRKSSSAEPTWDDLLTDLAHDQKHLNG